MKTKGGRKGYRWDSICSRTDRFSARDKFRGKDRASCREADEERRAGTFYTGKRAQPRHLDANVEKGGRSGILCPVTLPREPHVYVPSCHHDVHLHAGQNKTTIPTSFRRRIYTSPISPLLFPLSSSGDKFVVDVFVPVYTSRNRNSAATRKCLAFLRPVQSPEDVILSPLFRTRNAYRYDTRRAWTPVVIDVFGEEEKCDCNLSFFPDDSPLEELLSHGASRSLPFCLRFAIDLPSFPFDTTYLTIISIIREDFQFVRRRARGKKNPSIFVIRFPINETDRSVRWTQLPPFMLLVSVSFPFVHCRLYSPSFYRRYTRTWCFENVSYPPLLFH